MKQDFSKYHYIFSNYIQKGIFWGILQFYRLFPSRLAHQVLSRFVAIFYHRARAKFVNMFVYTYNSVFYHFQVNVTRFWWKQPIMTFQNHRYPVLEPPWCVRLLRSLLNKTLRWSSSEKAWHRYTRAEFICLFTKLRNISKQDSVLSSVSTTNE